VDHLVIPPYPDFKDLLSNIRDHMQLNIFSQRDMWDFNLLIEE
jgi:hypothetical protein